MSHQCVSYNAKKTSAQMTQFPFVSIHTRRRTVQRQANDIETLDCIFVAALLTGDHVTQSVAPFPQQLPTHLGCKTDRINSISSCCCCVRSLHHVWCTDAKRFSALILSTVGKSRMAQFPGSKNNRTTPLHAVPEAAVQTIRYRKVIWCVFLFFAFRLAMADAAL